jgi:hypothetical protein
MLQELEEDICGFVNNSKYGGIKRVPLTLGGLMATRICAMSTISHHSQKEGPLHLRFELGYGESFHNVTSLCLVGA